MSPSHHPTDAIKRRLAEQYINTYCRETQIPDPRIGDDTALPAALMPVLSAWRTAGLMPFLLSLPGNDQCLAGAFSHFSPIGYHRLASAVWHRQGTHWSPLGEIEELTDMIAAALAANSLASATVQDNQLRLQALMRNSIANVRRFHQGLPASDRPDYVKSEQGLRFGHIFHVTSKASDGFSETDLPAYAPELGASFQLHYFAVRSELLDMQTIGRKAVPIDPGARDFAATLLQEGEYRLLPCHPWQAAYLLRQNNIAMLIRDGALISLGPLGEQVWPTSSVRTVWLPQQHLFLKLSLNIRITNFVRNNPDEQITRALDSSKALSLLPPDRTHHASFRILQEMGSATLKLADPELRAACAVIYRQAMTPQEAQSMHLVAALLEESALGHMPLLDVLRQAAGTAPLDSALLHRWWQRYLDVTLLPMLELFADYGISLEAHLQNSLIAFTDGWPSCGLARDMEGSAISRQRFPWLDQLSGNSPALYEEAQAWHRFQYYVLVNHIAHVAACLARLDLCDEPSLWQDAVQRLQTCSENARPLVQTLLQQTSLPAKANMLSSFHQQGETPVWIEIPNPLKK